MSKHIEHRNEMEIVEPKIFIYSSLALYKRIVILTCRITRLSAVDLAVTII